MSNITDALPISKKDIFALIDNLIPSGAIMWFDLDEPPEGWEIYTPLLGKYPLGSTDNIGTAVDAGLPNITGQTLAHGGDKHTGPFLDTGKNATGNDDGVNGKDSIISFDASRCSDVYGKSNTVTPPSVKLLPCRKK